MNSNWKSGDIWANGLGQKRRNLQNWVQVVFSQVSIFDIGRNCKICYSIKFPLWWCIFDIKLYSTCFRLEKGENLNAEAVYKAFEEMDLDCSKSLDWTEFVVCDFWL